MDIYLKLDVCLQADIFNVFRNTIWNKFEIDCSKYITSCSLSLDLMLKYTGVKIELIRDISIFGHLHPSTNGSALLEHLAQEISPNCEFNSDNIKILDSCSNDLKLRYAESIHLKHSKQTLNTQERSIPLMVV